MNSSDASFSITVIAGFIFLSIAVIFISKCDRDFNAISAGYSQQVDPNTNKIIWVAPTNPKIEK